MKAHNLPLAALAIALCLSCSTTPRGSSGGDFSLTLRAASEKEIMRYGPDLSNPYILQRGMFLVPTEEFVVLMVEATMPSDARVQLNGINALDSGPKYLSADDIKDWWMRRRSDEAEDRSKQSRIGLSYFPSGPFTMRAGSHSYYIVLIGDKPIKKPFDLVAHFVVNGERQETYLRVE